MFSLTVTPYSPTCKRHKKRIIKLLQQTSMKNNSSSNNARLLQHNLLNQRDSVVIYYRKIKKKHEKMTIFVSRFILVRLNAPRSHIYSLVEQTSLYLFYYFTYSGNLESCSFINQNEKHP